MRARETARSRITCEEITAKAYIECRSWWTIRREEPAKPRTENKAPPVVTDGANGCCDLKLEFVAQSELQDAGIGGASNFPVV